MLNLGHCHPGVVAAIAAESLIKLLCFVVLGVVTLAVLKADDGSTYRGFVTGADNSFGFPSKDRSGRLDPIEEPHLGRLIAKCLGQTNTSDNTN